MIYLFKEEERVSKETLKKVYDKMPPKRRESINKIRDYKRARQGILAYALLSYGADLEYGIKKLPDYTILEYGKPSLNLGFSFNLSHCDKRQICAISAKPVGIDAEKKDFFILEAASYFTTEKEREIIKEKVELAPLLWTLKEAYGKYKGVGLNYETEEVELVSYCESHKRIGKNYVISWQEEEYAYAFFGEEPLEIKVIGCDELFEDGEK